MQHRIFWATLWFQPGNTVRHDIGIFGGRARSRDRRFSYSFNTRTSTVRTSTLQYSTLVESSVEWVSSFLWFLAHAPFPNQHTNLLTARANTQHTNTTRNILARWRWTDLFDWDARNHYQPQEVLSNPSSVRNQYKSIEKQHRSLFKTARGHNFARMFFRRLTPRERTLGTIGGIIVGGSIFKVRTISTS